MAKKTVKRNTVPPIDLSTSMMFKNNPKVVKPTVSKSKTVKPTGVTRKATEDPNYRNLQNKLNARVVYDYEKKKTPEPKKSESKTVTKAPAKTVSQIWKEKTGKDWSEAKKLGLSDGSASSNMALLKKLNSGSLSNSDLSSSKFKEVGTLEPKKATEISTTNNNTTMKKGGSIKKMANGGVTPSDSTKIYVKKAEKALGAGDMKKGKKALSDAARQGLKGKAGFDELGKWKYKTGGTKTSKLKEGIKSTPGAKTVIKAVKSMPEYKAYKAVGKTAKSIDDSIEKRYPNYTGKGSMYDGAKQAAKTLLGYKTGGMVNSNAKVTASKVAKGRPAKSAEPRTAAKKATGKVGGVSKAPKAAAPKMKMGGSMKKKSC
jgi:hypothetical protein